MNNKIIRYILITIIVVLCFVELVYLVLVPALLNSFVKKGKLSQLILSNTGMVLEYDNLKAKTYPDFSFSVNADNIAIVTKNNDKPFYAKKIKTSIYLLPVICKKLNLKYFKANNLYLSLMADKNQNIFFAGIPLNFTLDDSINADLNGIKIADSVIELGNSFSGNSNKIDIQNAEFYYKKNRSTGLLIKSKIYSSGSDLTDIDIKFSSKLPIEKGFTGNKFVLNSEVKNLNLSDYSLYLSSIYTDINDVNGLINAEFSNNNNVLIGKINLKNFAVNMKNPNDSIYSNSDIDALTELKFSHNKLLIDNLSLSSNDWALSVNGNIKNYTTDNLKNVKPDLNVSVKNSDIHSLYWLLPSLEEDKMEIVRKLKKYGAWGRANGTLHVSGNAQLPLLYGNLDLDDVYIVKNNPIVEHCKVYTEFFGDKLNLKTKVWVGYGEYVDIEGSSKLEAYGKGEFWVKSSPDVDLATAEYMLIPIHDIVGFELGPVPYMKIKGKGNIDIHTKGTVFDGYVNGQFNFKKVDAELEGLSGTLSEANGSLVFDKQDMHFYTTSSKMYNKPIKIDGKANLDGNIDFDVTSDNQQIENLFELLNTSSIVESKKHLIEPIEKVSGVTSIKLKILGKVKDFSTIKDNETLVIKGELGLKNVFGKLKFSPISLNKIQGRVLFDNDGWTADLTGFAGASKIFLDGWTNKNKVDINIKGNSLNLDDVLNVLNSSSLPDIKKISFLSNVQKTNTLVDFIAKYKSDNGIASDKFNYNNINAKGRLYPVAKPALSYLNGINCDFTLSKGILVLKNFTTSVFDSKIFAEIKALNLFDNKPIINGKINISEFNIANLNTIRKQEILKGEIGELVNAYDDYHGTISTALKIKNNNLDGEIHLKNIKFNHSYFKTPISIDSGKIILNNSKVIMKSMIANVDNTPVFLNFSVWDIDKTMKINGYFTTKLTDRFVNKYVNPYLVYPVKPKGDITLTSDINGTPDSVNVHSKLRIAQDSDIYYMGANLGDEKNEREVIADINITNNRYILKKLEYIRYMISQNDRTYPLTILTANGVFDKVVINDKKTFNIKNLNVQTLNNANVKIFNVIFKKSVLKNGMFNCKLNIKGNINSPVINGTVAMNNIDMPLFETIVKNISLKFNDKNIDIVADGIVLNSDFSVSAVMKNKLVAPYVFDSLVVNSKKLNLDNFIDFLTKIPTPDVTTKLVQAPGQTSLPVNVSDVQIKKGSFEIKDIIIRDLAAKNCKSEFTLGENMLLDIPNLWFDVEGGKMKGSASYNFANGKIKANVSALKVDSNKVASNLFGVKDQIFGVANGDISITTKGRTEDERIKNMMGSVYFEIVDGKMPKLGSVEYLLKAGNFIKSGITGASINNFIALLAPIKTGHFDSIKGSFGLKNGVAQNIEVYSKGENLNLFINGDYDILQQYADLRVFGRLTRNAASILGPVGNLSFNSLLNSIPGIKFDKNDKNNIIKEINKIPGVELSDKEYRVFTVKIDGHFNDDKFVKNFRWVE